MKINIKVFVLYLIDRQNDRIKREEKHCHQVIFIYNDKKNEIIPLLQSQTEEALEMLRSQLIFI